MSLKKVLLSLSLFLTLSIGAETKFQVPESTDNVGMGKLDRINALEKELIKLAQYVNDLETRLSKLEKMKSAQ